MDQKRRDILEYELETEQQKQRALRERLQSDIAIGKKERIFLIEQYDEHGRNVSAIKRELSKLPALPPSPKKLKAEDDKRTALIQQQQQQQEQQREQQRRSLLLRLADEARKQFAIRNLIDVTDDEEKRALLIKRHDQHTRNIIALKRQLALLGPPVLSGDFADSNADNSSN